MLDAVGSHPDLSEPNQTGFSLSKSTSSSIYEMLGRSPNQAASFASAMKVFSAQPAHLTHFITHHYP